MKRPKVRISIKIILVLVMTLVFISTTTSLIVLHNSVVTISEYRNSLYRNTLNSAVAALRTNCEHLSTTMEVTALDQAVRGNIFQSDVDDVEMLAVGRQMRKVIESNTYLLCPGIQIASHKFFTYLPSDGKNFFPKERMKLEPWYEDFMASGQSTWHCTQYSDMSSAYQYVLVHAINDFNANLPRTTEDTRVCYEAITVNIPALMPTYYDVFSDAQGEVFLFSKDGNAMMASSSLLEKSALEALEELKGQPGQVADPILVEAEEYCPVYQEIPEMDAFLVIMFLPLQNSKSAIKEDTLVILVLVSVFALLSLTLFFFYLGYRSRLRKMMHQLDYFDESSPVVEDLPPRGDEVDEMDRHIVLMQNRIRTLIEEEYSAKLEAAAAQHESLMACVNPHFLYNTLNSISSMATLEGAQDTNKMIYALSNMFKYSSDTVHKEVTLWQEMENIKDYLYIQSVRFGSSFVYKIKIPEDLLACLVPKLVLQPVVENCFKHGFNSRDHGVGTNIICISSMQVGEKLLISVTDNGKGMTQERLTEIRGRLTSDSSARDSLSSTEVGLCNVHKRLQLLYGKKYGITLECREGCYTAIKITVAYRKAEEKKNAKDSNS